MTAGGDEDEDAHRDGDAVAEAHPASYGGDGDGGGSEGGRSAGGRGA